MAALLGNLKNKKTFLIFPPIVTCLIIPGGPNAFSRFHRQTGQLKKRAKTRFFAEVLWYRTKPPPVLIHHPQTITLKPCR
jgi:hypothetical protein